MIRVCQIATHVHDPSAGTTYAVNRLCESLAGVGVGVELHALEPLPDTPAHGYTCHGYPQWRFPAALHVSTAMRRGLTDAARRCDILHTHGMWTMPNVYPGPIARRTSRPLVFATHGMVAPWALAQSRLKKAIFMIAGQRAALDATTCFHATADAEFEEIRRLRLHQPVSIIPFGIDLPAVPWPAPGPRRRLLFLSRIHPKKGVDVLLRAWQAVEHRFPDWDLVICGPDNAGYLDTMRALARELGVARVEFAGPRFGAEKDAEFAACELFVLPTFNENFGFVVAEALARGRPAIVTTAAPWRGLRDHDCGWWIATGVDALVACLETALAAPPDALWQRGLRGRDWAARELAWEPVAERMWATYAWLLGQRARPDFVRVD